MKVWVSARRVRGYILCTPEADEGLLYFRPVEDNGPIILPYPEGPFVMLFPGLDLRYFSFKDEEGSSVRAERIYVRPGPDWEGGGYLVHFTIFSSTRSYNPRWALWWVPDKGEPTLLQGNEAISFEALVPTGRWRAEVMP